MRIALTLIKPSGIDTPIAQHAANHVDGEALIPATLVAETILQAAQHVTARSRSAGRGRSRRRSACISRRFSIDCRDC